MSYDVERTYRAALGAKLAEYILAEDDVNVSWPCQMSDGNLIKDSIISYLDCLGENLIIRLMAKGLDMNLHGYEHYVRGNYSNSFNFHIYTNNYVWVDRKKNRNDQHF